jgi:hypothetical protein
MAFLAAGRRPRREVASLFNGSHPVSYSLSFDVSYISATIKRLIEIFKLIFCASLRFRPLWAFQAGNDCIIPATDPDLLSVV